jgi:hypothetical protein
MTTVPATATAPPAQRRAPALPTAEQVVLLQAVRGYPAVSLLMNTTPSPALTGGEAARLHQLLAQATRRLRAEGPGDAPAAALANLERLVDDAVGGPTSAALALFAGPRTAMALRLPVEVKERVVVDPTFATRDLVRSLHRTPRHVVLVLSSREARLFEGAGDQLRPARTSAFRCARRGSARAPAAGRTATTRTPPPSCAASTARWAPTCACTRPRWCWPAARACWPPSPACRPTSAASPGPSRSTCRASRSRPWPSGSGPRWRTTCSPASTRRWRCWTGGSGARRAVSGMADAWLAARTERPEALLVEQGLFFPARLSQDGDLLVPATDVEHPEVVDDAVDELIELVLDRGGWVALVDDGLLDAHGGVALTLRSGH